MVKITIILILMYSLPHNSRFLMVSANSHQLVLAEYAEHAITRQQASSRNIRRISCISCIRVLCCRGGFGIAHIFKCFPKDSIWLVVAVWNVENARNVWNAMAVFKTCTYTVSWSFKSFEHLVEFLLLAWLDFRISLGGIYPRPIRLA